MLFSCCNSAADYESSYSCISFRALCVCCERAQGVLSTRITVPVLIQNSQHQSVVGLTRESLVISEHKIPITDFIVLPTANLPLQLGILLDVSGSEHGNNPQILFTVARDFAEDVLRSPEDRAFFGAFDAKLAVTPWLSREETQRLSPEVKVGGGTALYDSIVAACERMGEPDSNKPTRRCSW